MIDLSIFPPYFYVVILILTFFYSIIYNVRWHHIGKVLQSYWMLNKFVKIGKQNNGKARQFGFLRKCVDPYVFEEMILTALKKSGYKIKRNKRYSHDGGIDGQCWIKGKRHLIQAKRYSSHINPQHVKSFSEICLKRKSRGLFVHTGKTGQGSKLCQGSIVDIISGEKLLHLLESQDQRGVL